MIRPTRSSPAGDDKPTTVGGPVEPASVEKSGAIDEPSPPANDVKSDSTREYAKSVCPTIGGIMALASVLSFVIASVALLDCLDDLKGIGRPLVAVQVELRVPRIWTQLMLRSLGDQGSIEVSRFASLSAKLVGCGYTFTQSDDAILCECGQMATWKFDKWPLRHAIETLGTTSVRLEPALGMAAKMTAKAYLELVVPEDRRKVLVVILAALGRRGDFRGDAVDAFGRLLINAFGLNSWVAQDAIKTFEAWRRGRGIL